ncbi:cytochrome P450 [Actinomadura madurae]|uniref:cytochrome P450 n=1 Tax=Actinomadura madurae TaxID=1993 RepID=UPI0020263D68|nr:cytochrome P450 [Actinomadura madurae]URM93872.1 cytochrome P450 [Actinomadura madurae]URN04595.1 cytochrome P450 [Actinomadura madurae]
MTEMMRGCPVSHTEYGDDSALYEHYALLDAEREAARFHYNDTRPRGFWMVQRYEDVLEGFQKHDAWTTHARSALNPEAGIALLPQDLNGQEHAKLRRVLNPFFSPAAVRRMEELAHERCVELIEEVRPKGGCDFVAEFAIRYPTDLFLALLGLPVSDGEFFLPWSETLFAGFFGGDPDAAAAAKGKILEYFDGAVNERRAAPGDPKLDMVSRLVEARIDGEPLAQDDILTICMTLMLAGLDTTRSALGFIITHLARHEEDRQRIIAEPEVVPAAVEEFLRLYPLVFQAGREVREPGEFHGLDLEKGDVVWLGIASANRDPRKYPEPDRFVIGRRGVNQNLAFGAGPHRCLGMHLARLELAVVLREWHARIPDYRIAPGARLTERGGQLTMPNLPLEWTV